MKNLLTGKRKLKYDENITLREEGIQRKLPQNLKDSGRFTIPCTIGNLKIGNALCDLGASINLMPISMLEKVDWTFGCVRVKFTPHNTYICICLQFKRTELHIPFIINH